MERSLYEFIHSFIHSAFILSVTRFEFRDRGIFFSFSFFTGCGGRAGVKRWDGEVALQISFTHLFILHLFFQLLDLNSMTYIQISVLCVCKAKPSLNIPHSCVTNCNIFQHAR